MTQQGILVLQGEEEVKLSDDFEAFEYVGRKPHDSVAYGAPQGFEKRFARPGTSAQGFDGRHHVGSNADLQDGRH